jgi:lipid II:glycine glycyltransferase (peptidoglycan interpeptide bridge formation enzyme)
MALTIRPITDQTQWNNFIISCPVQTFLHSWQWGQVQQQMGEPVQCLGIFSHDQLIGAALVITVQARRGWHYLIPHGPVAADDATVYRIIPALIQHLQIKAPSRIAAIRIAPLLVSSPITDAFFTRHNFVPAPLHVHAELTWVLDINHSDEELLAGMRKTTRQSIRKALAQGVTTTIVTDDTALPNFWQLYQQTKQRHHFIPWSYNMLAAQLKTFSSTSNVFTITAQHENRAVAAAILIHFGSTVYYYHGASVKLPSSVPASQLIQWHAIQAARARQANLYNFWGIAPDNQPHHPFTGITTFKKGFGGHAINYAHAQDLPLNWRYWPLWSLEKYRQLKKGF